MIKGILLILCLTTYAQADMWPFPYEKELINTYLEMPKTEVERVKAIEFIQEKVSAWEEFAVPNNQTKEEMIYSVRITRMMAEIITHLENYQKLQIPRFPGERDLIKMYLEKRNTKPADNKVKEIGESIIKWYEQIKPFPKSAIDMAYKYRIYFMLMDIITTKR